MSAGPSVWQQVWDNAQPRLNSLVALISHDYSKFSSRVGQLDAEQLDHDLIQILKEPVGRALDLIHSSLSVRIEPELVLIIQAVLYKHSVWDAGATQGANLQGLRYKLPKELPGSRTPSNLPLRRMLLHAACTLLVPYLHDRTRVFALTRSWPDAPSQNYRRKAWQTLITAEAFHRTLALCNFVVFLWNGRYRTVVDRLLGLQLVPAHLSVTRNVSYEFMNRQMVWHAFTEFVLFLLPMINTRAVRRWLGKAMQSSWLAPTLKTRLRLLLGIASHDPAAFSRFSKLSTDQCAICAEDSSFDLQSRAQAQLPGSVPGDIPDHPIQTKYITSCGHTYCYFCLAKRMVRAADEGEEGWRCLRCGQTVTGARRFDAHADELDDTTSIDSLDVDSVSLNSYESFPRSSPEM